MKRLLLALAATAITAATLTGCGVPAESSPRPVELPGRTAGSSADQTPAPVGPLTETLYLIKDSRLVAVQRNIPLQPTAEQQLRELLAGPTPPEQDQGLSSALAGTELGLSVQIRNRQAVVELATSLEGTGRTDDILAFAQIVCTLTSRDDVSSVTFTRAGQQVEVPRAGGSLTRNPLTAADYASLTTKK